MKNFRRPMLLCLSAVLVAGLAACDKKGPEETAGKETKLTDTQPAAKSDTTANTVGVAIDDATLTTKVKSALSVNPDLASLPISVDTVNGVVTLSGSVDTMASSNKAQTVASEVSGVKQVDNRLVLKATN